MKRHIYYKNLFLIGGLWNLGAALPCWLGIVFMPEVTFKLFGIPPATSLFPFHAMLMFIMTYGIGYIIVSRDISKNHGIVIIGGIIGKIFYFIDCLYALIMNEGNLLLVSTGIVDIIFAILFIEFLLSVRKGLLYDKVT